MGKKFDIHEWQAKQWLKNQLNEQNDFVPDLEDDDLKRSKIQQMMAKEKESEYKLSDQEKDSLHDMVIEFAKQLTDPDKGNYSGDRLLAALQFIILEIENLEPMLYHDLATGYDEELDEANMTGTGTSISAGEGPQYATPAAFAKKGQWKRKNEKYEE